MTARHCNAYNRFAPAVRTTRGSPFSLTPGRVGPTVGTFSTLTQNLAKRTPTQFTLSSTSTDLDLLETDVLGYASLHAVGGATVPQSVIRTNMKVQ